MVERVHTDGCSSFSETSTDGCPPLYVSDIEISLEEVTTTPNFHEHEDLVATKEKVLGSISPSPHELHEVDPVMEDEEEVHLQEPYFLVGSLQMDGKNIQKSLKTLRGTHS